MKIKATILPGIVVFCLAHSFSLLSQPCKEVMGYYPNWQWYDRTKLVNPKTIKYSKYSIITIAFFAPKPDGSITGTDSWADENILLGDINWQTTPPSYLPNTSIVDLAHNNNVKVLISVGGWSLSNDFPQIAADAGKRAKFSGECVRLIRDYKLDGIDIDWEYPGYAEHNGTPADKVNFTVFLQQIRDSINAYGQKSGKPVLLTAALGASPSHASYVEWNKISGILDMINLMSYDYYGAWDASSNHNAPLYPPAIGDPAFALDASFKMLTQTYGVPAGKINIGVAFYGRTVTNCTALHGTHSGLGDKGTFSEDEGTPMYYNVMNKMNQFNRFWDTKANVPYLLGKTISTFVSYDDPQSIALKAKYIADNNARGAIIWELTGDYMETSPGSGVIGRTPLVDTLNYVLCNTVTAVSPVSGIQLKLLVFPNPASQQFMINYRLSENSAVKICMYDVLGKEVILVNNENQAAGEHLLSIAASGLQNGIYVVKISVNGKQETQKLIVNSF